jgi:Ulp1 family protease
LNPAEPKHKIGIIFNTDPHYLTGSHWISLFIDIKKRFIFFFDSTGDAPPKEITQFVKKIIKQGKALGLNFKYVVNDKEHQKRNTECGIYSLFMIINLLKETRTPEDFLTMLFTDKEMERFRSIFFNQEEL